MFKIHLRLHHYLPLEKSAWFGWYVGVLVALPILWWRDFWQLGRQFPQHTAAVGLGVVLFVLGGFGSDWVSQWVLQPLVPVAVEPIRIAFEEWCELVGENFVVLGVVTFVGCKLDRLKADDVRCR